MTGVVPDTRQAGVMRFDPAAAAPQLEPFTAGLQMANGAAFDAAGNLYVTDTTNPGVTKIRRDGTVDATFARDAPVAGGDGAVVAGGELFVTQFSDASSSIARIPLADPKAFSTLTSLSPGGGDPKLLDDAALGPDGRLYVASNQGRLLRVDRTTGDACTLVTGLPPVDSVRFAIGFAPYDPATDLFLTSQDGEVVHAHLRPGSAGTAKPSAARPAMRLRVTPRRLRRGRRVTVHAVVRSAAPACRAGVRVRVGRRSVWTDKRGRAVLRLRPRSLALRTVSATKVGCRRAVARVRVRR